jgi:lincosamide and streptogramin A transport system ATP-binding/permease protein
MQSRVKNFEKRIDREIEEKEGLLNDIENVDDLKLFSLTHHKSCLVECRDFELGYTGAQNILEGITFQLMQGDIIFLNGANGCGKSSLIKAILKDIYLKNDQSVDNENSKLLGRMLGVDESGETEILSNMITSGRLETASGLVVSYINQDTSHLSGNLKDYAEKNGLDYSLFLTLLRKLDMNRIQFEKNIEDYSEGQKKKVLIAASLLTPAHLYIWDEPMNYIDVFSRMQIEKLIETYKPTMIMVEHDARFREKLATKVIDL